MRSVEAGAATPTLTLPLAGGGECSPSLFQRKGLLGPSPLQGEGRVGVGLLSALDLVLEDHRPVDDPQVTVGGNGQPVGRPIHLDPAQVSAGKIDHLDAPDVSDIDSALPVDGDR